MDGFELQNSKEYKQWKHKVKKGNTEKQSTLSLESTFQYNTLKIFPLNSVTNKPDRNLSSLIHNRC